MGNLIKSTAICKGYCANPLFWHVISVNILLLTKLNNIFPLPLLLLGSTYTYKNVFRLVLEYFSCLYPIVPILPTGGPVLRYLFQCGSLINLALGVNNDSEPWAKKATEAHHPEGSTAHGTCHGIPLHAEHRVL
jgi:hypothetical protein